MPATAPADPAAAGTPRLAPLWPRFGALVYDSLLLFGIGFVAGWIYVVAAGDATSGTARWAFQGYLILVFGAYFVFCWSRTGQTLGMKTWGLRLVRPDGGRLGTGLAAARYGLAVLGLLALAAGFLWALADRDRQFLHDRLLGTRIRRAPI